jgi:hypothetical protein
MHRSSQNLFSIGVAGSHRHWLMSMVCALLLIPVASAQNSLQKNASEPVPAIFHDAPRSFRLLVIAPAEWSGALEPFIEYKNRTRMPAYLVTVEGLVKEFKGRDDPERIKKGIEYTHRVFGAGYVMLAGDASKIPVRYRFVREAKDPKVGHWAGWHDGSYIPSDLYYANLYQGHVKQKGRAVLLDGDTPVRFGRFDTWDRNGDGKFNEQEWGPNIAWRYNPDHVDGYPDIAVGRIPAHTEAEIKLYTEKVQHYEANALPVAERHYTFFGDKEYETADALSDDVIAGMGKAVARQQVNRVWLHYGKSRPPAGWLAGDGRSIARFAGQSWWVSYIGHGWPGGWAVDGGSQRDIRKFPASEHWPIVFAASCETGQFTHGPPGPYLDTKGEKRWFVYHEEANKRPWIEDKMTGKEVPRPLQVPPPSPYDFPDARDRCVASAWLFSPGGGIAYFGEMVVMPNGPGRDLEKRMLATAGRSRTLGDMWLQGQRRYWIDFVTCGDVFGEPRIYLGIMTMFGDPSLRLERVAVEGGIGRLTSDALQCVVS